MPATAASYTARNHGRKAGSGPQTLSFLRGAKGLIEIYWSKDLARDLRKQAAGSSKGFVAPNTAAGGDWAQNTAACMPIEKEKPAQQDDTLHPLHLLLAKGFWYYKDTSGTDFCKENGLFCRFGPGGDPKVILASEAREAGAGSHPAIWNTLTSVGVCVSHPGWVLD